MTKPPFRADHVGSFLRPEALIDARAAHRGGHHRRRRDCAPSRTRRSATWSRCRKGSGFRAITDGEFRRTYFHTDFLLQLDGVEEAGGTQVKFHQHGGKELEYAPPVMKITGKVGHARDIQRADYEFLASCTDRTPKVTIPSPTMLHFRGGREAIDADRLSRPRGVLRRSRRRLSRRDRQPGRCRLPLPPARRHQPRLSVRRHPARECPEARHGPRRTAAPLCAPDQREHPRPARRHGGRRPPVPRQLSARPGRPRAATSRSPKCCSTNSRSTAISSNTTIPARAISRRCASCPRARPWCSAWSPPSSASSNSRTTFERRIDEAAKFAPLDQLALSPQCGFSSTVHGNDIEVEQQAAKMRLVIDVAREVWGDGLTPELADQHRRQHQPADQCDLGGG